MKRKILYILLPIFFFFFNVNIAFADESTNCAKQQEKIDTYDYLKAQLEGIDCTNNNDQTIVAACNSNNTRKNIIVTELMKINDEGNVCSDKQEEINKIIEENEGKCGKIFDDWFSDFVNGFMTFFYVLGPILLILFGTLDFTKATLSADQDALRKAWKDFSKRIAATILLFATPTIVNLIISLNISDKYLSGNAYSCDYDYLVYTKKYSIKYVPKSNSSTTSNQIGQIVEGGITSDEEADALEVSLTNSLNTQIHRGTGEYQNGPFPKWWSYPYSQLSPFQCTWWANGRASQYLEAHGTKYTKYPTQWGHGGSYYDINKSEGYFKYGQTPKPNSIISWKHGTEFGHVAYVEGVTSDAIYISHAGSGKSWLGIDKIGIDGDVGWAGYTLNGYIYLDEPIE